MSSLEIQKLSPHLFWDTDKSQLDLQQSKSFIIQRVVAYGLLQDWQMIKNTYGLEEIKKVVIASRTLDPVTLSFLCTLFHLNKEDFRCYATKQSTPDFWTH
jgi:hypothetical protein